MERVVEHRGGGISEVVRGMIDDAYEDVMRERRWSDWWLWRLRMCRIRKRCRGSWRRLMRRAVFRSYLINISSRWEPCVFTLTLALSHQGRGDKTPTRTPYSVAGHL